MNEKENPGAKIPLGLSDFRRIAEENYFYVDKTLLIREIWDASLVVLIPRPRRFGKTLNQSMLKSFFEKSETPKKPLFNDLQIASDTEMMAHQGCYPVISLTFKDVNAPNYERCLQHMKQVIAAEFSRHEYACAGLGTFERAEYQKIISLEGDETSYERSLQMLSKVLTDYHGKRAVVLIDEYDMPLHAAVNHGYADQALSFLRNLLSGVLKDNDYLEKGVLTGILRVARESIFSGLNNLSVFTLLDQGFSDKFGLTAHEVEAALRSFDLLDHQSDVEEWYNGYLIGNHRMYNPWSILQFLQLKTLEPYWVNTSDNALIRDLMIRGDRRLHEEAAALLTGQTITVQLDENITFKDLGDDSDTIWNFMVFTGYLTVSAFSTNKSGSYKLKIPNNELREFFKSTFARWTRPAKILNRLPKISRALEQCDPKALQEHLNALAGAVLSYHDVSANTEKVYHAFVLGLLVAFDDTWRISSNREAGLGRYDIMLWPRTKGSAGVVIEFKQIQSGDPEPMLDEALNQIITRDYVAPMREDQITPIHIIGIVFQGKQVRVKARTLT